jgi:hypothetical protein
MDARLTRPRPASILLQGWLPVRPRSQLRKKMDAQGSRIGPTLQAPSFGKRGYGSPAQQSNRLAARCPYLLPSSFLILPFCQPPFPISVNEPPARWAYAPEGVNKRFKNSEQKPTT